MSSTPTKNAREVFLTAIEQYAPDQWPAYLDQACSGDQELRSHVESLLRAHQELGTFTEDESSASPTALHLVEQAGTTIGPYKLLQQIGEGGMGVVYMAEQTQPVERRVALKIIKPGMDTRKVIARFEAERQALAMMDYPNIAKVLDAGTTETGRPYFVMELVKGVPVTEYCDQQKLTTRQRLELFMPICQAVQHAHQKGIIHRDLKPSNVLIAQYDDRPVPKIIDFGVAKAIEQRLTEKTVFTEFGQVVGTVEYMSPEQAQLNQLDIDTRTDVYSLGVLLYELLTGETPFDRERLRSAAFDEMLRIIREEEPPRPSLRLSTSESLPSIAANRHIEPRQLSTLVHGELDWIVMKALEKDRTRRYDTASKLAEDVQHYLNDEAVLACPPSTLYRFRKFVRKNKLLFVTTMAITCALIVGTGLATWQSIRALQAEAVARQRFEEIQAVTDFLVNDLLTAPADEWKLEREITVSEVLENAEAKVDFALKNQPLVEAAVRKVIANSYLVLGRPESALAHARRAQELQTRVLGATSHDTLESTTLLAKVLIALDRQAEARQLSEDTLKAAERTLGPTHPDTIGSTNLLVNAIVEDPRHDSRDVSYAMNLIDETILLSRQHLGEVHQHTLEARTLKALLLQSRGENEKAEELWRSTLTLSQKNLGSGHPTTLKLMRNIADVFQRRQQLTEAAKLYEVVLESQRSELGIKNPTTLATLELLVHVKTLLFHHSESLELSDQGLSACEKVYGPNHPKTLEWKQRVVYATRQQDEYEKAYLLQKEIVESRQQKDGGEHPLTLLAKQQLAYDMYLTDRFDESLALLDQVIEVGMRLLQPSSETLIDAMSIRGGVLKKMGRLEEAQQAMEQAIEYRRRVRPGDDEPVLGMAELCKLLLDRGEVEAAKKLIDETIEKLPPNEWQTRNRLAWRLAADQSEKIRNPRQALKLATEACELTAYEAPTTLDTLAVAYAANGDFESAIKWAERAIELATPSDSKRFQLRLDSFRQSKPWVIH